MGDGRMQPGEDDAARAFAALQAEVATLRQAVEALPATPRRSAPS